METLNQTPETRETNKSPRNHKGRIFGGLIIVVVGVVILLRQAGFYLPGWIFSWHTALIVLGLYLGVRHSFKGIVWLIPVVIGSVLLLDRFYYFDLSDYLWPALIIVAGLYMIFRSSRRCDDTKYRKWEGTQPQTDGADVLDSAVVFGGVKKNVVSKNFLGGEAVTVFGGTDINLMQADINGKVVLELTQVFGGTKLLVPANWKVQTEDMVAIFGGVEDKRPLLTDTSTIEQNKILVLKGTCIFGGIDIKSY